MLHSGVVSHFFGMRSLHIARKHQATQNPKPCKQNTCLLNPKPLNPNPSKGANQPSVSSCSPWNKHGTSKAGFYQDSSESVSLRGRLGLTVLGLGMLKGLGLRLRV